MPGYLKKGFIKTVFMTISVLLCAAGAATAGDEFERGLSSGRTHGEEMLLRHKDSLSPSSPGVLPGYDAQAHKELESDGARWTQSPGVMREEAEEASRNTNPETSDAAGHLRQSYGTRPPSPETQTVIKNSRETMDDPECEDGGDCEAQTAVRCAAGDDCFDTSVTKNTDFPRAASRMALLADMERCIGTTSDGQISDGGYWPIEIDGKTGETARPIDCADVSAGEMTVFKGKRYRCDLNLAGFVQNCCAKKGIFSGACPQSTKVLRARRDGAGACRYIGIHRKKVLGITVKKREVYCCFNSKMARVVHEQTRGQLLKKGLWDVTENGGWGGAKNPHCGGMTTEQLQAIDFEAVDFSEIHGELVDGAKIPKLSDSKESTEEDIGDLCPKDSLGCGGEEGR